MCLNFYRCAAVTENLNYFFFFLLGRILWITENLLLKTKISLKIALGNNNEQYFKPVKLLSDTFLFQCLSFYCRVSLIKQKMYNTFVCIYRFSFLFSKSLYFIIYLPVKMFAKSSTNTIQCNWICTTVGKR